MKKYKNYNVLSGLLFIGILTGLFCVIPPKTAVAQGPDLRIPDQVKGKRFTIFFGNGDSLSQVSVVDVVSIDNEPWWKVSFPTPTPNAGTVFYTVNPRQIRMISGLP